MNLSAIDKVTKNKVKTSGVTPFQELDIEKVYANPNQPRKSFEEIDDLAASIKEHGLIQPIAVVSDGAGMFMIISGERRYRATKHLDHRTIKAHIIQADSNKVQELSLIENIQRSDLTDLEVAKYISILWNSGQYAKKADLAKAIGKSPSYISKAFGCLKLDSEIIKDIEENQNDLPLSVLEEIARVKDKDVQKEVYEKYLAGEITRDEIKDYKPGAKEKEPKDKRYDDKVFEVDESENFPREKFNWNIQGELDDLEVWDGINAQLVEMKIKSPNLNIKITIEEI